MYLVQKKAPMDGTARINVSTQNIVMQLRKVCNHPYLVEWPLDSTGQVAVDERLVASCGKMLLLDRLLPRLLADGHKVAVLLFGLVVLM
jgi:ATP-dependent DNA helicase